MIPDDVVMQKVESTNVLAFGYNEARRELFVEFRGGTRYRYSDVPPEIFTDLAIAPSAGSFLHRNIAHNPKFHCTKLTAEREPHGGPAKAT